MISHYCRPSKTRKVKTFISFSPRLIKFQRNCWDTISHSIEEAQPIEGRLNSYEFLRTTQTIEKANKRNKDKKQRRSKIRSRLLKHLEHCHSHSPPSLTWGELTNSGIKKIQSLKSLLLVLILYSLPLHIKNRRKT